MYSMYSMYSKYYDQLDINNSNWLFSFIDKQIEKIPHKSRMIELGCGTGNVLLHYKDKFSLTGVDISPHMLDQAKLKIPTGVFYQKDMVQFKDNSKYDVVLCLFDSINHVLNINNWEKIFTNVNDYLTPNGIFIFDMNTTEKLKRLEKKSAFFYEFDSNYFYMKLIKKNDKNFIIDIRVLKKIRDNIYEEERDEIEETTAKGSEIYYKVKKFFTKVDIYNVKQEKITSEHFEENEKHRWFFCCRK